MSEFEPLRVLVVDDHPMVSQIIAIACNERPSLQVVGQAADGWEALEQCELLHPDVVVLDLGLPGLSGFEVLVRLREHFPSTRVLIVSGRDDRAAVFESVRLGADGYLEKTGSVDEIAAAVEAVGQGTKVFSVDHQRAIRVELGDLVRRSRVAASLAGQLTRREREILDLLALGLSTRLIGSRLRISERTAEAHARSLYRKLGVRSRLQAVHRAAEMNLLKLAGSSHMGRMNGVSPTPVAFGTRPN
jgi:DNA-binding NarL/FixJ family response regulator